MCGWVGDPVVLPLCYPGDRFGKTRLNVLSRLFLNFPVSAYRTLRIRANFTCTVTAFIRWDEKAGLQRDAISSR